MAVISNAARLVVIFLIILCSSAQAKDTEEKKLASAIASLIKDEIPNKRNMEELFDITFERNPNSTGNRNIYHSWQINKPISLKANLTLREINFESQVSISFDFGRINRAHKNDTKNFCLEMLHIQPFLKEWAHKEIHELHSPRVDEYTRLDNRRLLMITSPRSGCIHFLHIFYES